MSQQHDDEAAYYAKKSKDSSQAAMYIGYMFLVLFCISIVFVGVNWLFDLLTNFVSRI